MTTTYGATETFAQIVEEVLSNIQGFTASPDQMTSLTADIAAGDTTFKVDDATGLAAGLVEVGEELVWVRSFDQTSSTLQTLPNGRGFRGTQADSHTAGTPVTIAPAVPRSAVIREINNVIRSLWPAIYGVSTNEFTYSDHRKLAYGLPADVEAILDVRWKDQYGNWQSVPQYNVLQSSNTTDFPTGISMRILGVPVGYTVRVIYGKRPSVLTTLGQTWTDCGLGGGSKDLLVLGAMARLLPMMDVARLSVVTASADEMDQPRPLGSALTIAKSFRDAFTQRLNEERDVLNRRYPPRWHRMIH